MAEPFQFDWTTAVPVDDEPQPSAPSTPTPPESVDAVMSATPFGAQNMPRPQQGPVDAYEEFDWKTAEPLDGGFDPSTAREATPAEDAEFYEQISNTAYLPTKDEWRWRENFRKQRDDKVSRFIEGGKAMAGGLVQAAAATAFAPFDFLRRGTAAYNEWVNSSAEGVRQTGIATAELWSWAGDVIADRGKEIERNAALDAKLRQQLASENRFTGNAETDGQVFLQAREAAMASGFYDKTPEELAGDEDTQYQRFIRDRSFQQQAENITETNIGTLPDGRAEMGIDESKLNPGLVTTTQLIADPLNIAAGGLGFLGKLRPLRRAAALAGKPLELGGKAAGSAAQKADELYAGVVNVIEKNTGLDGAQQMSALQNTVTWKAAAAMATLKGAGGILRTGQTWLDTGSIFVREAGTGGVGVARVEAAGKLRTAPIPERYRRAYDGFFTSADSTLRRVSETPGLSPVARRSAATLDRIGATQAFRVADDAIGGALATAPIAVPLAAISPEERQPEMLGGLMTVGAVGGVVGGKVRRVTESDDALVAKMLADVEISGGDATSMANMLSHDKLLRMAQMQTVMSAKADFVPLRAKDYELNPTVNEHMGKNSRGFYVDATKGQRPRVFVNLDKLATGDVVGHEIGHAILKSDILGGQIKQGMRSVVDAQYGADGIAARGREYVKAQLTQEVNHRATGIEIEVLTPEESQRKAAGASMDELVADRWKNNPTWREQQINERVDLLNQEALGNGEMSFDWARDEIVAETFSGLGKGINVAGLRASGPMGRTLGAMQTAMETMGARFTGSGRLESPNRLFTENPLFDTPQMRKAVNNYVKLYDRYLVGLEKEGKVKQRGRPIAPTGRPEEAARSPHTRTYDNNGVLESELFIERPDGTRIPKSQQMIDTQEKARAATLKSINNRTRFVDENSNEWGARKLSNGRIEVGGPNLPPQFDYFVQVPQWLRDKAREFEAERAKGRSYLYSYNAIGTGEAGSYKIKNLGNVEAKTGEMVPFGWAVSTKNHLLAKVIDLNSFRAAAMRAIDKGQLGEFGNNLRTVEADLKRLMRNHEEGRPGETGLGVTKKNILNGLLGTGTPTNRASNPAWHTLNNQGSIRTFRFDRLNYADQFDTGYFPHYQKININALPDDAGRMSLDEYMRFDADRQVAWLNKRARERGYTNSTNWANSDEAGFAAASDEYRKLFPRPDNNNRMPQALPRDAMGMPDVPANLSTDQILRELEENQGYLGLSTLGMREGRPVKGGAQRTRELLKRNTALNEELRRRGGPQEESDVARVLRQRGQAMPDVADAGDQGVAMPKGTVTQLTNTARKALPKLPQGAKSVPKLVIKRIEKSDIVVDGGNPKSWKDYADQHLMPLPNIKLDKVKGVSFSKQDIYDVAQTDRARAQANAQQSVQAAALAAADPLKFVDPVGYSEIMRASGVVGDILIPPSGLKLMLTDPAAFVGLLDGGFHGKRTVPGTRAAAMQGLDGVTEMRQLVGGQPSSFNTALHHFWGTLSKQLDVINQEAAWMRLVLDPAIIEAIDMSIAGKFSMQPKAWEALVAKALDGTQGDFRGKGNNAKSNANSFYKALVYHNGRWDEVAALYANNNAIDMRAQFNALGHGKVGMKNKVQGFVGLSFGIKGSVLDRWRFVDLYLPDVMNLTGASTPEQYFKYVGAQKVIPQDPIGIYKNYGTLENSNPAFSLALYNSLDSVAQVAINNSPELRNYLGAHADPGGLHWVTWNSIKNEAVGHSSLDITKNFVRQYGRNGSASDFAKFMRTAEGFVEGSNDAGRITRISLKNGVFSYSEQ